jgi:hypothetical protein
MCTWLHLHHEFEWQGCCFVFRCVVLPRIVPAVGAQRFLLSEGVSGTWGFPKAAESGCFLHLPVSFLPILQTVSIDLHCHLSVTVREKKPKQNTEMIKVGKMVPLGQC